MSELPEDVQSYDLTLFFTTGNDNNNNFSKVQFHLTTLGIYRFGQGTQNQGDNISKTYLAPHRTNFRQPDDDNANNDNNGNDKEESDTPEEKPFSADEQYWEIVFNNFIE